MSSLRQGQAVPPFFTGRSSFLQANPYLAQSMLHAAGRCEIQSSEDIYDANGVMLWARQRRIGPELMAKLADRRLLKPIELSVTALDPVSTLALASSLDSLCEQSPDFALLLSPCRGELIEMLTQLALNPQEQLLLSVLRFGECDRLTHSLAVAVTAVIASRWLDLGPHQQHQVLRAGLLHDVGQLYLPDSRTRAQAEFVHHRHPLIGAQCVAELARSGPTIADLIAQSHERLNGQGFPKGLRGAQLGKPAQAVAFAEAVAAHLSQIGMGALRAAISARVVPGEFAEELIDGISSLAKSASIGPSCQVPTLPPERVGWAMGHLHSELSRVVVLLSMTFGEPDPVREAAQVWLELVEPLMRAFRCAGIEDALAQGLEVRPENPVEHSELAALYEEVETRVRKLMRNIDFRCTLSAPLADSRLVHETRRLLLSACSRPNMPRNT